MSWTGHMATDEEHRAPGRLELVRAFVNTLDVEEGTDRLADGAEAGEWAAEWDLPAPGASAERERLVALREALRQLMLANNAGEPPPPAALDELNRQAEAAAIGLHFDAGGSALVTRCDGADATIAAVLARTHEAIAEDTWGGSRSARPRLPVGVLRPLAKPLRDLVRDGRLRQSREGARLPRAPPRLRLAVA